MVAFICKVLAVLAKFWLSINQVGLMCNFFFLLPGKIFLETLVVDEIQGGGKRGSIFVSAHATAIPTSEFTNLTSKELCECLHTV